MFKTDQLIQRGVQVKGSDIIFYFMEVYGLYAIHDREQLWLDLWFLLINAQMPILFMGNFNLMLSGDDRIHESPVQDGETKTLQISLLIHT